MCTLKRFISEAHHRISNDVKVGLSLFFFFFTSPPDNQLPSM